MSGLHQGAHLEYEMPGVQKFLGFYIVIHFLVYHIVVYVTVTTCA